MSIADNRDGPDNSIAVGCSGCPQCSCNLSGDNGEDIVSQVALNHCHTPQMGTGSSQLYLFTCYYSILPHRDMTAVARLDCKLEVSLFVLSVKETNSNLTVKQEVLVVLVP